MDDLEVTIFVVGESLPGRTFTPGGEGDGGMLEDVRVGIQRGRESEDEHPAEGGPVRFRPTFRVRPGKDGRPNFLGPYAQGTPQDRFFYLTWTAAHPCERAGFRRLKVRLGHLEWPDIEAAARGEGEITVHLQLTDARGGPLCATPPATHIRWSILPGGGE